MTDHNGSPDWAALLEQATPRTKTVRLCLRGDLLSALAAAEEAVESPSLGGEPEHVKQLREQVADASVEFTLRGLTGAKFQSLQDTYRDAEGDMSTTQQERFHEHLVRECTVSPVIAADQPLAEVLTAGEFQRLWTTAIYATVEVDEVPLPRRG